MLFRSCVVQDLGRECRLDLRTSGRRGYEDVLYELGARMTIFKSGQARNVICGSTAESGEGWAIETMRCGKAKG